MLISQDLLRVLRNDDPEEAGGGAAPPVVDPNVAAMAILQKQIDDLKADNERERQRYAEQEASTKYWWVRSKRLQSIWECPRRSLA